jgi:hypothetical protein
MPSIRRSRLWRKPLETSRRSAAATKVAARLRLLDQRSRLVGPAVIVAFVPQAAVVRALFGGKSVSALALRDHRRGERQPTPRMCKEPGGRVAALPSGAVQKSRRSRVQLQPASAAHARGEGVELDDV